MTSKSQSIPSDWQVQTLADLGGKVTSGSRGWAKYYAEHGNLFVRITNLDRNDIHLDLRDPQYVQINPNEAEARRTLLAPGDLLISITADIGIIGYVDGKTPMPAYINQHIARVRLDHRLADSRFIAYYLASWEPQRHFIEATDQGAKTGMNLATVVELSTLVPSVEEQSRIAGALADIDDLVAMLKSQIGKKMAVKQGMMQQLLTGRMRFAGFTGPSAAGMLGDIADVVMGQSPLGTSYNRDGVGDPLINGPTEFTNSHPIPKQWTTAPVRFCERGDVLICVRGSSTGRMNIADQRYCIGRGVAAVRAKGPNDQNYVRYALSAVVEELLKLQSGSTFPSIDSRVIRGGGILLPESSEQSAIGEALADADNEIDALRTRLSKARNIKLGMMQQLLTGRIRLPMRKPSCEHRKVYTPVLGTQEGLREPERGGSHSRWPQC